MKRTDTILVFVALAAMIMSSSCSGEDRFNTKYMPLETHTIFNITVVKNTKTKSESNSQKITRACAVDTKAYNDDTKTSYDAEKKDATIDANTAFGLVGRDVESKDVLIDAQPVNEVNGVRSANLVNYVEFGEERARFLGADAVSDRKDACNRSYVVPEVLTDRSCVEVFFDVDPFDYDGTHYRGAKGCSEIIPLSGVVPDDKLELGLQYTFVLGVNLESIYRPIEFTASVDDWESKFNGRILDFDNE